MPDAREGRGPKQLEDYRTVLKWKKHAKPRSAPPRKTPAARREADLAQCEESLTSQTVRTAAVVAGLEEATAQIKKASEMLKDSQHIMSCTQPIDVKLKLSLPRLPSNPTAMLSDGTRAGQQVARDRMALATRATDAVQQNVTKLRNLRDELEKQRGAADEAYKMVCTRTKQLLTTAERTERVLSARGDALTNTGIAVFEWLPDELVVRTALTLPSSCFPRALGSPRCARLQILILSMMCNPGARVVCRRFKALFDAGKKERAKLWFRWNTMNVVKCAMPPHWMVFASSNTIRKVNGRVVAIKTDGYTIQGGSVVPHPILSARFGTAAMVLCCVSPINSSHIYVNIKTGEETVLTEVPEIIDPADDNLLKYNGHTVVKKKPDGTEVWRFSAINNLWKVVAGFGYVFVGTRGSYVYDLNPATGTVLHKYDVGMYMNTLSLYPLGCIVTGRDSKTIWRLYDKKIRALAEPRHYVKTPVTTMTGMVCFTFQMGEQWYTLS